MPAPATPRLNLNDVTLVAITSVNVPLTLRAMEICIAQCEFAEAILFSHLPTPGPFRHVKIDPITSREAYSQFVLKRLEHFIETPFMLIVQWDGYILNPSAWSEDFRQYDYIGARWTWNKDGLTVGNGGFSLRTKRLMRLMANSRAIDPVTEFQDDEIICCLARKSLENDHGIRFAPEKVADRFSYERITPTAPTFGFHGLFNLPRHTPDPEIIPIIHQLEDPTLRTPEYAQLAAIYYTQKKWEPLRAMYQRWTTIMTLKEIHDLVCSTKGAEFTTPFMETCVQQQ